MGKILHHGPCQAKLASLHFYSLYVQNWPSNTHKFRLWKPVWIVAEPDWGLLESRWSSQKLLQGLNSDSLERHQRFTGRTYRMRAGGEAMVPLLSLPTRADRQEPYPNFYHPGYHCSSGPGDSQRICPTKFEGPPSHFQWLFLLIRMSELCKII